MNQSAPPSFVRLLVFGLLLSAAGGCALTADDVVHSVILPEQRTIEHRDPSELPPARIPPNTPPRTVQDPQLDSPEWRLSLDEALRISLENAKVIRVLAGTAATTSGQTIYEAAITNTTIDQAQAALTQRWRKRAHSPTATILRRLRIRLLPLERSYSTGRLIPSSLRRGFEQNETSSAVIEAGSNRC